MLTFKSIKNAAKRDKPSLNQKGDYFFLFILLNSIVHFYNIYACFCTTHGAWGNHTIDMCVSLEKTEWNKRKKIVLACSWMNENENLDRKNSVDIVTLGKCSHGLSISHMRKVCHSNIIGKL